MDNIQNFRITADDIKLLYDAIALRNDVSHASTSPRSIGWGDVVRMEEILLDGDLLRRLVAARNGGKPDRP